MQSRVLKSWTVPHVLVRCGGLFGLATLALTADAQVNSWTNPVSGYWQDPFWSLGVLPGPGQTIMFTNAGWKALAIGPGTAEEFPQTLNVDSVTVASPP